ncbi:MAG: anthranilate phosphoribosyltransferase, partial [Kordiimonadaceae bacterium]|nr:anthranilate phosphoribosyltransferase [Kordiimonadaceae bacterium]
MSGLKPFLSLVADGKTLSEVEARDAFSVIMEGEATDAQIGGFLMALRLRGETIDEITGAALILREKAVTVSAPAGAIDT